MSEGKGKKQVYQSYTVYRKRQDSTHKSNGKGKGRGNKKTSWYSMNMLCSNDSSLLK